MKKRIKQLLEYIEMYDASDVHFTLQNGQLFVRIRGIDGIKEIKHKLLDENLFHYLKFIANLDLGNSLLPQSGNFSYTFKKKQLQFRFSYLRTMQLQTGVLRILNNHKHFIIEDLTTDINQIELFKCWLQRSSGLILLSGPTGAGKTTTLHALLERLSTYENKHVITLEDPIEIQTTSYLQLQINEKVDFTYAEGIKQVLRHDPDVIMIGEIRDEVTAKQLITAALSGHLVLSTIHAKSCVDVIKRMLDFGVSELDLKETLCGLTSQRIFKAKDEEKRICIYEMMDEADIARVLKGEPLDENYETMEDKIRLAKQRNQI
ncbi:MULTISPECIES: ATPase, T2SS/T4P/T4SS family [unclassified Breznakia]|uniref:ATPase, T2SS/T4P/T4SS family n=1 Tax=unclassified Breznakia TaxID=2623764 RepID=UPI002475828C|nr:MULTISPECIES: ATPase, T2SS/T4P/T4SS family [unclassified Breznakia]MDH6366711.1 competence protein ComGA [Breznakia sp. PH1-1]MDH6403902.1 competence protein ComGA [Breznakia sp. PF1-11]MDH6411611.1 competence protein ComGA [Breznakia sp. PFB1-11]MDH6413975.1 competence protein ComGA [Breznakia sp. PFB1-14]MDH6416404.1 competence protein ComGA [Breznakia sp. PFB1-4]